LRNLLEVSYIPLLSVRPAELRALKELPNKTKDRLFPSLTLRPWTTAHHLGSVLAKIDEAYGARPLIADAGAEEPIEGASRPVHEQLALLRNPADGYRNWFDFLVEHENYIPTLQLTDITQIELEVQRLAELERGLVIRVSEGVFSSAIDLVQIAKISIPEDQICVVFDYEQRSRELLTRAAAVRALAATIFSESPECSIALSASSFPIDFIGRSRQEIYERQLFNQVCEVLNGGNLIYSDRGSARAERQIGGGGTPAPRIDLAGNDQWSFFREEDDGDRNAAYFAAAVRAMDDDLWDDDLQVWGTQMIRRTADEDDEAIISPARSTAARINIHLQQQEFYDNPEEKYDTDEDWED
jgi:hypothetical protein